MVGGRPGLMHGGRVIVPRHRVELSIPIWNLVVRMNLKVNLTWPVLFKHVDSLTQVAARQWTQS
jgi:hypothetical protein